MNTATTTEHIGREIYWNINIPDPWRTIMIVALGFVPLVWVVLDLRARWNEWKEVGALDDLPPRSEWPARCKRVLKHTLGQFRVKRRKSGGWSHLAFFYSFIILFIGTVIVAFQADVAKPLLDWYFFEGKFYLGFSFILEVAGIIGMIAIAIAIHRRTTQKPKYLGGSIDWLPSLWWFQVVMVTGYILEGARISGTGFPPYEKGASFIGWGIALMIPQDFAVPLHFFLWWGHFAIAIAFLGTFGTAAMSHIFVGAFNIFRARELPSGASPRPIENIEEAETFGVLTVDQFKRAHLLDADVCVECGRCVQVCPANITGKPLSPKAIVNQVRDAWREEMLPALRRGGEHGLNLTEMVANDGRITPDELWACTTCGACEQECPMLIEIVEKVVDLRRGQVLMKSDFPAEVQVAFTNLEQQGNPWGKPAEERDKWIAEIAREDDINIPMVGTPEAESADYLFWVGCAGAIDARAKTITKATARLLHRGGVKFAVLGSMETCTGDPALRVGNEYLYQILAKQNIETLREAKIPRVIASCPHCLQTLVKDYRALGLTLEVVHHSEVLKRLLEEGKIAAHEEVKAQAVIHDSCYLARHNNIETEPRAVIAGATGKMPDEPGRCGKKGLCCGAGGGRMWMEEHLGHTKINHERAEELLSTGANTIVTSCPFCKTMLTDGSKEVAKGRKVEVLDIAELLDRAVGPKSH